MQQRILFVFLDGVGLGAPSPHNPLSTLSLPSFEHLAGGQRWTAEAPPVRQAGHVFLPIDANLDLDGLPQSGTGQASLFTGVNCARIAGRHFGPFPHSKTRPVIAEKNIFRLLTNENGLAISDVAFANAYPERFFSFVRTSDRWTVTTLCCAEAGVPLLSEDELVRGEAVAADITGAGWPGSPLRVIDEDEAADNLVRIARRRRFTLFEYYLTDKAGHGRAGAKPDEILASLERFFAGIIRRSAPDLSVVITSDHGNLEDVSTRSHTRNPVPLIVLGPAARFFEDAKSILDVTPAIVEVLRPATAP